MKEKIISQISTECPWRDTLYWYDTIDSTNTQAKILASQGAPHGTVIISGHQSAGRGRIGRSFHSPHGKGLYLSVILRPNCHAQQLMHLTCAVGVAVCNAVENASGFRPGIKWINDLIADNKKLGGILTELSFQPGTQNISYAIIGIGINRTHSTTDFPDELQTVATSLSCVLNKEVSAETLAASVVDALWHLDRDLLTQKAQIMSRYRIDCVTLDKDIMLIRGEDISYAHAIGIEDDGSLCVKFPDGQTALINSGEASVRGMYGYV